MRSSRSRAGCLACSFGGALRVGSSDASEDSLSF